MQVSVVFCGCLDVFLNVGHVTLLCLTVSMATGSGTCASRWWNRSSSCGRRWRTRRGTSFPIWLDRSSALRSSRTKVFHTFTVCCFSLFNSTPWQPLGLNSLVIRKLVLPLIQDVMKCEQAASHNFRRVSFPGYCASLVTMGILEYRTLKKNLTSDRFKNLRIQDSVTMVYLRIQDSVKM